jgi:hypothetical protein
MRLHVMFIHTMPTLFKTVTVYYAMGVEILGARLCRQLEIFMTAPNICRSTVFNLLCVVLLPPEILRWFLNFLKIHEPLH